MPPSSDIVLASLTSCTQIIRHRSGKLISRWTNDIPDDETALADYGRTDLWEEYLSRFYWHGTSEQWIKRFCEKCPGCRVSIEKNGGCDQMVCRQCNLSFRWSLAKIFNKCENRRWWRRTAYRIVKIFYICLTIILMFSFIKFFLFHKDRIMSTGYNILLYLKFLFYCVFDYLI